MQKHRLGEKIFTEQIEYGNEMNWKTIKKLKKQRKKFVIRYAN